MNPLLRVRLVRSCRGPLRRLVLSVLVAGLTAVLAAAGGGGASAFDYMETFDLVDDPGSVFGGNLLVGSDGTWTGALEDGVYVLSNPEGDGAVRFFSLGLSDGSLPVSVGVTLEGRFDGQFAGAGLLYRRDRVTKGYFAFIVTDEGYAVYKRTEAGLRPVSRGQIEAYDAEARNRLAVKLSGDRADLSINGARVFSLVSGGRPKGSEVGLIAFDRGAYRFDDFSLSTR